MTRKRPVGSAERIVLGRLHRAGGTWSRGQRALWENQHWTVTILDTLAGKGLVSEVIPGSTYELTPDGVDAADPNGFN